MLDCSFSSSPVVQTTMEGSRTIRSAKEIEHLLRDYPAALDLYRTGKYKVKVKSDAEVERVILVEKRTTKTIGSTQPTSATVNDNQENNQTVSDLSSHVDENKDIKQQNEPTRRSRSRSHSPDRAAPLTDNIVHTTISSIRMTSNTQPKVGHHRTPSREREVSATPPQKQVVHGRSQSREGPYKTPYGRHTNRDYSKMMVPFIPKVNNAANPWQQAPQQQQQQQQRTPQPYFSNPLLQPQPQARSNLYTSPAFVPQANALYRQSCYFGQGTSTPIVFAQQ